MVACCASFGSELSVGEALSVFALAVIIAVGSQFELVAEDAVGVLIRSVVNAGYGELGDGATLAGSVAAGATGA